MAGSQYRDGRVAVLDSAGRVAGHGGLGPVPGARAASVRSNAIRLFRWRNYQDYGTGVAGDLFVHLLSGLHVATGSMGPERILATGGLRYWKDGRDVPDVMLAMLDYPKQKAHPEFTMALRVNLKSGVPQEQFGFRFMGSEGVITTSMSSLRWRRRRRSASRDTRWARFPRRCRQEFMRQYREKYPAAAKPAAKIEPEIFTPPAGVRRASRSPSRVLRSGTGEEAAGGGRGVRLPGGRPGAAGERQLLRKARLQVGLRRR